jgi:hypothetical protein
VLFPIVERVMFAFPATNIAPPRDAELFVAVTWSAIRLCAASAPPLTPLLPLNVTLERLTAFPRIPAPS